MGYAASQTMKTHTRIATCAAVAAVLAGSLFQTYFTFTPKAGDYASTFVAADDLQQRMLGNSAAAAANLDPSFYRIEERDRTVNLDGFNGTHGTTTWWSVLPASMTDYYIGLGLSDVTQNCNFKGLDGRPGLLGLASVRYLTCKANNRDFLPAEYELVVSAGTENVSENLVFEDVRALPLGYTFKSCISKADFDSADPLQKEQMLVQGAVVDHVPEGFELTDLQFDEREVDFEVVGNENATLGTQSLAIEKAGGSVTFSAQVPDDCQLYLVLDKPELAPTKSSTTMTVKRKGADGQYRTKTTLSNARYNWYVERDSLVFNLGYGGAGANEVVISCDDDCTVSFESLQLVAQPVESMQTAFDALGSCVLQNVHVGRDFITGSLDAPGDLILQFSIPYSSGWEARVDGEPAELFPSGGMYLGTTIAHGKHDVELRYRTPLLFEGAIVSLVTLLTLITCKTARKRPKVALRTAPFVITQKTHR